MLTPKATTGRLGEFEITLGLISTVLADLIAWKGLFLDTLIIRSLWEALRAGLVGSSSKEDFVILTIGGTKGSSTLDSNWASNNF